ncbi:MAG: TIGR00730 family Rossman fold protein [Chloroflexi bacterium]|nr:TIGR00730 family Rossman fold protein [Chloroflexota bacterium]MCL5274253.1 TIGR00730 family Rossman fold protein [Chloroflexota bacterium]
MSKSICVYSSSSNAIPQAYYQTAAELGALIAQHNHILVYGGSNVGLMGELARAVHQQRGKVVGVIPESIRARGVAYEQADELIVTRDLRSRKAVMETRSDAFIALPGGFGTLEEVIEVLTLKQLQAHDKPIVFLNQLGFYVRLFDLFEQFYAQQFTKSQYRQLYYDAPDAASALAYIESYQPTLLESKWS